MKDHNGYEWITQPCPKTWKMACTTVLHSGHKPASFTEVLTREIGGEKYEVRREYTCIPCHLFVLTAGKRIVGG